MRQRSDRKYGDAQPTQSTLNQQGGFIFILSFWFCIKALFSYFIRVSASKSY
jgi:hypothetical protein